MNFDHRVAHLTFRGKSVLLDYPRKLHYYPELGENILPIEVYPFPNEEVNDYRRVFYLDLKSVKYDCADLEEVYNFLDMLEKQNWLVYEDPEEEEPEEPEQNPYGLTDKERELAERFISSEIPNLPFDQRLDLALGDIANKLSDYPTCVLEELSEDLDQLAHIIEKIHDIKAEYRKDLIRKCRGQILDYQGSLKR